MTESTTAGAEQAPATPFPTPPTTPPATPPAMPPGLVPPPPDTPPALAGPGTEARTRKRRRLLRAAGRWTAAVAVFGVLGTGIAFGITEQERTDVPGLATAADGRWDYPKLTLPALPAGAPRPFAQGNEGEIHHADVRDLLLPVPEGATAAEGLPSIEGEWVSSDAFTELYAEGDRPDLKQQLTDDAVRHVAARGWAMPDGTRTSVHLLQFNSGAYPADFFGQALVRTVTPYVSLAGSHEEEIDESWPDEASVPSIQRYAFDETKPRGETHVRQAYLVAGDTLAVIVQSRPGTAPAVPFQQTVILQSQLLG